jgi:GT2 family glycosyltransferase
LSTNINRPLLSILIVNYNGAHFLDGCIGSILQQVKVSNEVIVVDNNSADDSANFIEANFPSVRLIRNSENSGFAKGNNIAARHASGDYFLLLNNDTTMQTDVAPAIEFLRQHRDIGALGFGMLDKAGNMRISTGHFPSPARLVRWNTIFHKRDTHASAGVTENKVVDWVEGSFLLTTREIWQAVGGLDEGYFMYVEDVDYCKSLAERGLKTMFMPSGKFVHFGGYNSSRLGMLIFGFRRYHERHSSWPVRTLANVVLTLGLAMRIGIFGVAYAATRSAHWKQRAGSCAKALASSPW